MINLDLLKEYGAVEKRLKKGGVLFHEGDTAYFYYQIISGVVKMNNYNTEGQETIQGIFHKGESFGEPALLGDFSFPANAEIIEDAVLICLEKQRFLELLKQNASVSLDLLKILSRRLQFKALLSKEIKGHEAEHRIITLLQYLKKKAGVVESYPIEMTRQTMANLTGLRVETVIKTLKKMSLEEKVEIRNRKLYF